MTLGVIDKRGHDVEGFKVLKQRRSIGWMSSEEISKVYKVVLIKSGWDKVEVEEWANLFQLGGLVPLLISLIVVKLSS